MPTLTGLFCHVGLTLAMWAHQQYCRQLDDSNARATHNSMWVTKSLTYRQALIVEYSIYNKVEGETNSCIDLEKFIKYPVVIGILLKSTAWYTGVKQHQPRLVGWMTVLVCKFMLIVLRMRL